MSWRPQIIRRPSELGATEVFQAVGLALLAHDVVDLAVERIDGADRLGDLLLDEGRALFGQRLDLTP